jgi:PilZ domain
MQATELPPHIGALDRNESIAEHLQSCPACQRTLLDSADFAARIAALTRAGAKEWKGQRRYERIRAGMEASVRILPSTASRSTPARVLFSSRESLKLSLPVYVRPGITVQIYAADTNVFGDVRYCQRLASVFHAGVQIRDSFPAPLGGSLELRRNDQRMVISVEAKLRLVGAEDLHTVTILDVSKSGMRIRSRMMIPAGTRIEVVYRNVVVAGEARYVRELGPAEFNVGVQADSVTEDDGNLRGEIDLTGLFVI